MRSFGTCQRKVKSKFLKLRKQLKRKQKEKLSSVAVWDYYATSRL